MASSTGVAILGAGIFAKKAHLPAVAAASSLSLKAVYSRSEESAQSLLDAVKETPSLASSTVDLFFDKASSGSAPANNLDALLARDDISTVILSLPILVQPGVIEKAWKAGKNVISEKPIAKDVAAAVELIELWEKEYKPKGVNWIIAEQYPFEQVYIKARELLASGAIGSLRTFDLSFYAYVARGGAYFETEWRKVPSYQGGFLLDGGVHYAAALRFLLSGLEEELASVSASSKLLQEHLPPHDTLFGLLETKKGVPGQFGISFGTEGAGPKSIVLRGSKGNIELAVNQGPNNIITVTGAAGSDEKAQTYELEGNLGVKAEFVAFGEALLKGIESPEAKEVDVRSGPRAALKDVEFIENALNSGESKAWIAFKH